VIEYDYTLERNEGDETKTYIPKAIRKNLDNVVEIEGPNACGKSTLLNILAAGFYGARMEKMNPALRSRINGLIESPHQKLKFEVKVTSRDGSITLTSRKPSSDKTEIVVRETEDGHNEILGPEQFHKKYNLIYDIPDNPTERLNQLILEIKDIQNRYAFRVAALRNHIHGVIDDIRKARDQGRIEQFRDAVTRSEKTLSDKRRQLEGNRSFLKIFEKYYFARSWDEGMKRLVQKDAEISDLKAFKKKMERDVNKSSTKLDQGLIEIRNKVLVMIGLHAEISSNLRPLIPQKEKHHLDIWERIDFDEAKRSGTFSPSFRSMILVFRQILSQLIGSDSRKELVNARFYSELVSFLSNYRHSGVVVPGLDKSVDEFISILDETNKHYERLKALSDKIDLLTRKFDDFEKLKREVEISLSELGDLKQEFYEHSERLEEESETEEKLERLKRDYSTLEQDTEYNRIECNKRNINKGNLEDALRELRKSPSLRAHTSTSDAQLRDSLDSLSEKVMRLETGVSGMKAEINFNKGELSRLENLKPHKYQDRLESLDDFFKKCNILEQRLSKQYAQYISSLSGKSTSTSRGDDERRYCAEVARFLGKKLGRIRHMENEYEVQRVDLIEKAIYTKGRKVIRFSDMGTGQGQSAYLLGLLSVHDKRKIIALFDEVAMMDTASLEPVYKKIKQLYDGDKLLMGVVVQKGDTVKITPKT
jgi:exonuclease SbcC